MEVDVRGLAVHVEVRGEGRPIVLLHGWPSDHRLMSVAFEPIFDVRPGWRRIYLDLPGMGATPGADWIRSHDEMLDVVDETTGAILGGGSFALAGASYGGYLALGLMHRRAELIDGLALIAPAIEADDSRARLPERRVLYSDPAVVAGLAEEERFWTQVSVVQTAENLAAFRAGVLPGLKLADHAFLGRVEAGPPLLVDVRRLSQPFDRPTLILAGRQDTNVGYLDSIDLLESYPRATLAILDRAGHGVRAEQNVLFKALVGEWLDRLELEPAT